MLQTDSAALGKVVNETAVIGLPLVTRNFAQIASLSPGVTTGVYNAGELGLGGTALSQIAKSNDGIANTNSNNVFGISEDRAQLSGSADSWRGWDRHRLRRQCNGPGQRPRSSELRHRHLKSNNL
jgi:hypothetical protein